jgi:hypothetical protein
VNQSNLARQYTAKDALRFSASVALLLVVVFFFCDAGHAQPTQANDPSGYRLIGTMEGSPLTGAVISDSTGTQTFYRVHELLPDGSQVVKVRSDSVSLKRSDGTTFDLYFRGSNSGNQQSSTPATAAAPPAEVQETRPVVERKPRSATLKRGDASAGQRPPKTKLRRHGSSTEE